MTDVEDLLGRGAAITANIVNAANAANTMTVPQLVRAAEDLQIARCVIGHAAASWW